MSPTNGPAGQGVYPAAIYLLPTSTLSTQEVPSLPVSDRASPVVSRLSMMAPTIIPKAQRQLQSRVLRRKAPLAAQFEDCFQVSIRLTDAIQANRPRSSQLRQLALSCHDKIRIWGDDSGAASRTLDYALKCAPTIAHQTQSLLAELLSVLDRAVASVRVYDEMELVENSDDSADDNPHSRRDGDDPDFQDSKPGTDAWLREAFDVLACLIRMLPSYRSAPDEHKPPVSDDDPDHGFSGHVPADSYIQAAADFFPTASRDLTNRLGNSNWRRQQCLHQLQSRVDATPVGGLLGTPTLEPAPPGRNGVLLPRSTTVDEFGVSRPSRWTASSSKTATTAETRITSLISRAHDSDHNSATSLMTESQQTFLLPQLAPPPPPVDLPTERQFQCPICHFELPLTVSAHGVTPSDWHDHVFMDLKPYICTFDNCSWDNALFGTKEEWFEHELDFHRSPTTWPCPCCRCDIFDDEDRLSSHIALMHEDHAGPTEREALAKGSRRYSQQEPLLDCRLCQCLCSDLSELRDHVGCHLENFALLVLPHEDTIMPDDRIPEDYSNIHDYLEDLSDDEVPPEMVGTGTILGDDSDVAVLDEDSGPSPREMQTLSVGEKIEEFLNQSEQSAHAWDSAVLEMHNVPPRDPRFFGRDDDLSRMHSSLDNMGRICTVTGRGGIGKTAIAGEYLHRYRSEYANIFWVDAESAGVLREQYNRIALALVPDERDSFIPDETSRLLFVRECLTRSERRWLLVLDNVTQWHDIARYVPRSLSRTRGSVLVTSRGTSPLHVPGDQLEDHVHLAPWSLNHSREFLLSSIKPSLKHGNLQAHDEYELAEHVVNKVDRLPLAVNMVVGYIKVSRCNLSEFLEMWDERESRRLPKTRKVAARGAGIDPTIDSLWEIGIGEVRANCRKLLDILSFFGSDTIPRSLLVGDHEEDYLDFLHVEESLR